MNAAGFSQFEMLRWSAGRVPGIPVEFGRMLVVPVLDGGRLDRKWHSGLSGPYAVELPAAGTSVEEARLEATTPPLGWWPRYGLVRAPEIVRLLLPGRLHISYRTRLELESIPSKPNPVCAKFGKGRDILSPRVGKYTDRRAKNLGQLGHVDPPEMAVGRSDGDDGCSFCDVQYNR